MFNNGFHFLSPTMGQMLQLRTGFMSFVHPKVRFYMLVEPFVEHRVFSSVCTTISMRSHHLFGLSLTATGGVFATDIRFNISWWKIREIALYLSITLPLGTALLIWVSERDKAEVITPNPSFHWTLRIKPRKASEFKR